MGGLSTSGYFDSDLFVLEVWELDNKYAAKLNRRAGGRPAGLPLVVPESYREIGLLSDERLTSEGGRLDFVTTFGLTFNATRLVATGMGYAVCLAGLADVSADSGLAFVPLDVRLDLPSYLVWKPFQLRTRACE